MGTLLTVLSIVVLLETVMVFWLFNRCGVVTARWEDGLRELRLANDQLEEQGRELDALRTRLLGTEPAPTLAADPSDRPRRTA